ncbi:MAG: hypothetical protein LBQ38_07420 [Spirochaetaceae bacterium]|jgi:hypothetical protein|nr:hypothetical protein [Spirochaetaceae bacterium]
MLLLSPEEFPVYLLEFPKLKGYPPKLIIESQLKTLYPGDPRDTEFDYYIRPIRGAKPPRWRAIVFVTSRAIRIRRTQENKLLFPGIALLSLAARSMKPKKKGAKTRLVFLLTPDWVEAARFDGKELTDHLTAPWPADGQDRNPPDLFSEMVTEEEITEDRLSMSIIVKEPLPGIARSFRSALESMFPNIVAIPFETLVRGIHGRKYALFGNKKKGKTGFVPLFCLMAGFGVLLFPLRSLSAEHERALSRLKAAYAAEQENSKTAGQYGGRLGGIPDQAQGQNQNSPDGDEQDYYRLIAALGSCLNGAWIRSLSLGEAGFSLDAEGADALGVVRALGRSPFFSGIILRQASPSKIRGEQFVISGSIVHEK